MRIVGVIDALRQPEYTGENRCAPCTVVNTAIAVVLASVASVTLTPLVGLLVFVSSLVTIYLRGYLVPGTPSITKRYFPASVLRLFGKDAPVERSFDPVGTDRNRGRAGTGVGVDAGGDARTDAAADAIDELLVAAGVLADADGTALTPEFRAAWRERMDAVEDRGPEPEDVRAIYDAETIDSHGATSFVVDKNKSVRWASEAALVADVAAATELREYTDVWTTLEKSERDAVLTGLRLFLERCPACDGALSSYEDRVDPCCQKPHLVVESVCTACDASIADAALPDTDEDTPVRVRLLRS